MKYISGHFLYIKGVLLQKLIVSHKIADNGKKINGDLVR